MVGDGGVRSLKRGPAASLRRVVLAVAARWVTTCRTMGERAGGWAAGLDTGSSDSYGDVCIPAGAGRGGGGTAGAPAGGDGGAPRAPADGGGRRPGARLLSVREG